MALCVLGDDDPWSSWHSSSGIAVQGVAIDVPTAAVQRAATLGLARARLDDAEEKIIELEASTAALTAQVADLTM